MWESDIVVAGDWLLEEERSVQRGEQPIDDLSFTIVWT